MKLSGRVIGREPMYVFVLLLILSCASAHAQTPAYLPDVITVNVGPAWPNPNVGAASFSPTSTLDGRQLNSLSTYYPAKGAPPHTTLVLGNFSSDPGPTYLQSVSCTTAAIGTKTLDGSAATRTFNSSTGSLTYFWQKLYIFEDLQAAQTAQCIFVHTGAWGWMRPKYDVVGLVYAPPGSKSTVNYTNGFQSGTSTMTTNTYSSAYTEKDTLTIGTGKLVPGVFSGSVTATYATGWGQTQESTNSVALSETYTTGLVQPGPASSALGVDHDYDVVYVWLNAEELVGIAGNVISRNGYGWDGRDSAATVCGAAGITGMDVVAITIGQLRGTQAIPTDLQCRLNRVWDSALGGLTSADMLEIAQADPFFSNPQFNPNTANSARYELPNGQNLIMNYIPAAPGAQPTTYTYTSSYSTTTTQGQSATDTHSRSWSLDASATYDYYVKITAAMNYSATYTTTNKNSSTITSATTQGASFSITGPATTDNYTGPTAMQVWKDNVYGTFMFFPEN
jgi:hypothetical protein